MIMMSIVIMVGSFVGCGKNAENTAVMNEMPEYINAGEYEIKFKFINDNYL